MYNKVMKISDREAVTPLFSICCPTRGRPKNVRRLIKSIKDNCHNFNDIEILFYVDRDDSTFPDDILSFNIKKIVGNRVWLNMANNILYAHSSGQIIMQAGDDIVFKTYGWDTIVKNTFDLYQDRIALVYGNDNGSYGSLIAIHGFVHKKWVEALGYFSYPGRTASADRWITEVAQRLGRAVYIPSLFIEHIHYRQGSRLAKFDKTYQEVDLKLKTWPWRVSYKKLKHERRADVVILTDHMNPKPKIEYNYFLGELLVKFQQKYGFAFGISRRIRSLNNFEILPKMFFNIIKIITRKM